MPSRSETHREAVTTTGAAANARAPASTGATGEAGAVKEGSGGAQPGATGEIGAVTEASGGTQPGAAGEPTDAPPTYSEGPYEIIPDYRIAREDGPPQYTPQDNHNRRAGTFLSRKSFLVSNTTCSRRTRECCRDDGPHGPPERSPPKHRLLGCHFHLVW